MPGWIDLCSLQHTNKALIFFSEENPGKLSSYIRFQFA